MTCTKGGFPMLIPSGCACHRAERDRLFNEELEKAVESSREALLDFLDDLVLKRWRGDPDA